MNISNLNANESLMKKCGEKRQRHYIIAILFCLCFSVLSFFVVMFTHFFIDISEKIEITFIDWAFIWLLITSLTIPLGLHLFVYTTEY